MRDGQVDCIVDCSADDEDTDASDGVSNRSADDESAESCGACTSRCAKLRIAPGFCKCTQCPDMDATPPPYEEGTQPPVPVDNPCKRRCDMLKIAPGPRMNACLDRCPTDDFYVR